MPQPPRRRRLDEQALSPDHTRVLPPKPKPKPEPKAQPKPEKK